MTKFSTLAVATLALTIPVLISGGACNDALSLVDPFVVVSKVLLVFSLTSLFVKMVGLAEGCGLVIVFRYWVCIFGLIYSLVIH